MAMKRLRGVVRWMLGGGVRRRICITLALALTVTISVVVFKKVRKAVRAAQAAQLKTYLAEFTHTDLGRQSAASRTMTRAGLTAIPVLAAALSDKEPAVRWWAATTLGEIGQRNKEAAKALAIRLPIEPIARVKCAIIHSLGRVGGEAELPALVHAMGETDEAVRSAAAAALAEIPSTNPERLAALADVLGDEDPLVQSASRRSLTVLQGDAQEVVAEGDPQRLRR